MLCNLQHDDVEVASTVTNLISKLQVSRSSQSMQKENFLLKSCIGTYGDENFYSSSKLLRKYIRDHNKNQTWDLAKVLTDEMKLRTLTDQDKENELSKEIKLAKKLLGNRCSSTNSGDVRSLTTDDLLVSNPFGVLSQTGTINQDKITSTISGFNTPKKGTFSSFEKIPAKRENTNSLHFSHFEPTRNSNSQYCRSEFESSLSDTDSTSTLNLFSLNGTSYTPHKVKYGSLAKDLKSSLEYRGGGNSSNHICSCPHDRGDHTCSSPTPTNLLQSEARTTGKSTNFTALAGQTPFRSGNHRTYQDDLSSCSGIGNFSETFSSVETNSVQFPIKSIDSASHISVPLHFDDKKSDVQEFIKQCLDEDYGDTITTKPGSVETLKNMIFTLQSMSSCETDFLNDSDTVENDIADSGGIVDGHSSLRRAMSHLSNLKSITAAQLDDN